MPLVSSPIKPFGSRHRKLLIILICLFLLLILGGIYWRIKFLQNQELSSYNSLTVKIAIANDHKDNNKIISLITDYQKQKHTQQHLYDTDITLGYAFNSIGQYDKGIIALKKADDMKLNISNSFLHGTMGSYYASTGDKSKAIAEFEQGIADAKRDNDPTTIANIRSYQDQVTSLEATK
jgi:tetratricopeptide (TPR) repeat protein